MLEATAVKPTKPRPGGHHPIRMNQRHVDLRKRHRTAVDGGMP